MFAQGYLNYFYYDMKEEKHKQKKALCNDNIDFS